MIIDSHCHLNYEPMSLSLKETIDRANKDGVKYLLTISTEDKSFDNILDIISSNNCVYGSYGIHPHEAKNHQSIKSEDIIKKIKLNTLLAKHFARWLGIFVKQICQLCHHCTAKLFCICYG